MLPARGRPGTPLMMSVARQLSGREVLNLAMGLDPEGVEVRHRQGPPMVQRLKTRHHMAARLIAAGLTLREAAAKVGYTPQRLGDMVRTDPAFQNLVAHYESMYEETDVEDAREMQGMWRGIGLESLEELSERLEDPTKRSQIPVAELRQLAVAASDRTDAPIKVAQQNSQPPARITVRLGPRDIRPQEGKIIDQDGAPADPVPSEEGDDV